LQWSGEYEYLVRIHERLKLVIPLPILIIFVLIYFNTQLVTKILIVLLAVPFSRVGSFWLLYFLNCNMSIAVWVGIIALAGLDAETGVFMLLYLDLAYEQWKKEGKLNTISDLKDAIMHGAVKRIRPKIVTVSVILAGLIPIMFSHGTGCGCNATDRRTHGRWRCHLHHPRADHLTFDIIDRAGKGIKKVVQGTWSLLPLHIINHPF